VSSHHPVMPQTRASTSRSETHAPLHVRQEHTSSLADRRAKQLPPHLLCPGSSNLLLQPKYMKNKFSLAIAPSNSCQQEPFDIKYTSMGKQFLLTKNPKQFLLGTTLVRQQELFSHGGIFNAKLEFIRPIKMDQGFYIFF
jgi:hypothetical protein